MGKIWVIGTRIFGVFMLLYSLLWTLFLGMAPCRTPKFLALFVICLFISGIGIIKLKIWARYAAIISLFGFIADQLYGFVTYYKKDIKYFLQDDGGIYTIIPLIIICFLFIPKVKEQFKPGGPNA